MSVHSKFLVHWTGRDFHCPYTVLTQPIRRQYVNRLRDDCLHGLFMKPGTEEIHGRDGTWVRATISRVCFTEIRLSQTQDHASRYGMLGMGFHRDFVIERMGNPAIYVQNADTGVIVQNLDRIRGCFEGDSRMLKALEIILGFVKNMSDQNRSDFQFYEEMEWRVVHLDHLVGTYIAEQDAHEGLYRLVLKPEDIRLMVFPDMSTKIMATEDQEIVGFFDGQFPMMVTLEDCQNF